MIRREPWRTLTFVAVPIGLVLLALFAWSVVYARANAPQYIRVEPAPDRPSIATVAYELRTMEEIARLAEMGDFRRFPALRSSGDLFSVDSGTAVRVLQQDGWYSRIEITDGPYTGRRVWVPSYLIGP